MTRALVTAFEPFGGDQINASLEAVRRLPSRIGSIEVTTTELPTSYARSLAVLENALAATRPEIVLCVGQAADRAALCVERVAINVQDARLADNDGAVPIDMPVAANGPAAYFATLPIKAAIAALRAAGLPAIVSNNAGTFVCNHVFYGLMHHAAVHGQTYLGGLLHVPRLQQQDDKPAVSETRTAAMPLSDIVRGIAIVLEITAAQRRFKAR